MTVAVRSPVVAGAFYPADPAELAGVVDTLVARGRDLLAREDRLPARPPKALVVPHAGYPYSGPTAGVGYATLLPGRGAIRRVVLLGPSHQVPVDGLAVPSVDAFETPLGRAPIDADARARALAVPGVRVDDVAHAPEHSLEVHLPFLERILGDVGVLPLVVGRVGSSRVADVLDALWDGPETLIVVSSDLSHYEDITSARVHDARTVRAIVEGEPDLIGPHDACGAYPVRGLLEAVRRHGLVARALDTRTSGDTAGPPDRVVGYAAVAFLEAEEQPA